MRPAEVLQVAETIVATLPAGQARIRAAAFLGRQAVEAALDDYWQIREPMVVEQSARIQFLCLQSYAGEELAEAASHVWWMLTRVCHHHVAELAPLEAEMRGMLDRARVVVGLIEAGSS